MGVRNTILSRSNGGSFPSFESMDVSIEEEVIAAQEMTDEDNLARAESAEIDTLLDTADQTAQGVDYIETAINAPVENGENTAGATQNEVALAEQVANMATVGTGEDADTVMPSSESYVGSTISTEGLKEIVRGTVRAIVEAIKKLWVRLKRFFRSCLSRLSSLKKSAKEIKERANKTTGTVKEKKIKIGSSTCAAIALEGSVKRTFSDINGGFKIIADYVDEASKKYAPIIGSAGEKIADAIGDIDPEKASAEESGYAGKVWSEVKKIDDAFSGMSTTTDKRYNDSGYVAQRSKVMLGDRAIFSRIRSGAKSGSQPSIAILSSARMSLDHYTDKVKDYTDGEFDTFTPSQSADAADVVLALVDSMAYYAEGKGFDKIERSRTKVEGALKKIESSSSNENVKGENAAALRRIIGMGHAFVAWSAQPVPSLFNHACATSRVFLTLASRSLSEYNNK